MASTNKQSQTIINHWLSLELPLRIDAKTKIKSIIGIKIYQFLKITNNLSLLLSYHDLSSNRTTL